MKIQKGIVKYKDRNDIVCTYGVTDDGRQYYFLDETDTKKFSNGNRVATTALVEAVDPMVKASNVGVIDNDGNVVVEFDNRSIKPVNDEIILVEKANPVSQSVIDALSLRSDPLSATKLVSTPATIKERLNTQMGTEGRYIFNDQFSEATLCDINGNNLLNGELYSFIAMANDKIYLSKNTADSAINEMQVAANGTLTSVDSQAIDVSNVAVDQNVVEGALANESVSTDAGTIENNGFNTQVQENVPATGFENNVVDTTSGMTPAEAAPVENVSAETVTDMSGVVEGNGFSADTQVDYTIPVTSTTGLSTNMFADPVTDMNLDQDNGLVNGVQDVLDGGVMSSGVTSASEEAQSDVYAAPVTGFENNTITDTMAGMPPIDINTSQDIASVPGEVSGEVNPMEEVATPSEVSSETDFAQGFGAETIASDVGEVSIPEDVPVTPSVFGVDANPMEEVATPNEVSSETGFAQGFGAEAIASDMGEVSIPEDMPVTPNDEVSQGISPVEEATQPIDVSSVTVDQNMIEGALASEAVPSEQLAEDIAKDLADIYGNASDTVVAAEEKPKEVNDSTGFELPTDVVVNNDEVVEEDSKEGQVLVEESVPEEDKRDEGTLGEVEVADDEVMPAPVVGDDDSFELPPVVEEEPEEVVVPEEKVVPVTPISSEDVASAVNASSDDSKADDASEEKDKVVEDEEEVPEDSKEDKEVVSGKPGEEVVASEGDRGLSEETEPVPEDEAEVSEEVEVAPEKVAVEKKADEPVSEVHEEPKEEEVPAAIDEKEDVVLDDVKLDDTITGRESDGLQDLADDRRSESNYASSLTDLYDIPRERIVRDTSMMDDGYSLGRADNQRSYYDREPISSYGANDYSIPARGVPQYSMYNDNYDGYDNIFKNAMPKPDRIVSPYGQFPGYKSSMIDNASIMSDVARSMSELMRKNKEQRGTILQYQEKLEAVEAQRRVLNEKYNDQTLRVESLSNKLRTLDDASTRLETKNQMLESRLRDQEKIIAEQERELNVLRPQLEGRQDLIKILADAKALLGTEGEYQEDSYYGRRVA